jgi:hypothetical protein
MDRQEILITFYDLVKYINGDSYWNLHDDIIKRLKREFGKSSGFWLIAENIIIEDNLAEDTGVENQDWYEVTERLKIGL